MARRIKAKSIVLDSWAIMAYMGDEPAGANVEAVLIEAHDHDLKIYMSVVNVAEFWYIFARETSEDDANQIIAELHQLGVEFVEADWEISLQAARFKTKGKMSLADCYAAALAISKRAELVTGDAEFKQVEGQ